MTIWTPQLDGARPAYRALVDALARDLASGRLVEGDRLPTQRELARHLGVSIGTVTRGYALAERRGWVRGEVGRGTFVAAPPDAAQHRLPVGDLGETVDGAVNLAMTWPLPSLDPDLGACLRQLGRDPSVSELLSYQPNAGSAHHRATGARWARRYGLEVAPQRVVATAGSQHGMHVVFGHLLQPGDTLLCEELTYPGVRAAASFAHVELVGLPLDGEGLDPDGFEAACRKGRARVLYTIPSIHNPTTATLSLERRRALVAIARRYGVAIVEDAVHHLLLEEPLPTIAGLAPECTYLLAAPSKVVAGGLRVGFVIAPEGAAPALGHAVWSTIWTTPPLCLEVFARWVDDGTADRVVAAKRAEAARRVRLAREVLGDEGLCAEPAGYHAWLEVPAACGSPAAFVAAAAGRGVLVVAADAFHLGSGRAPSAVRVSLSAPRREATLRTGLERLSAVLEQDPAAGAQHQAAIL